MGQVGVGADGVGDIAGLKFKVGGGQVGAEPGAEDGDDGGPGGGAQVELRQGFGRGVMASSIGEEMNYNPRLKLENSVEQFMQIMDELKLAPPKRIDEAVPANLRLGRPG